MILGVGTDMIEIDRMRKACEKEAFFMRVFTDKERGQARGNISMIAGDFAVKEAVSKTLGTGFRNFRPRDIEVLRNDLGKPYVVLYAGAKTRFEELGMERIEVSITNTKEYAFGFSVGEGMG